MTSNSVRRQRVANGSRRKRDLQAAGLVAQAQAGAGRREIEAAQHAEREARLRPQVRETDTALDAWAAIHATLLVDLRKSTFMLWVHPLLCIGEAENALCLSAPDHVRSWCERRYGHLLGGLVRELSDLAGVYLLAAEEPNEEDAPL
jgi:hypothetical protein